MNQLQINKTNNIQKKLDKVKVLLQNTSVKIMEKLLKNKTKKQNDNIDFIMQQFYILHLCQYQIFDTMQENAEGYYIEYIQSLYKTQQLLFKLRIVDNNTMTDMNNENLDNNFQINKQDSYTSSQLDDFDGQRNFKKKECLSNQFNNINGNNIEYKILEIQNQKPKIRKALNHYSTEKNLFEDSKNFEHKSRKEKENNHSNITKKLQKKQTTLNIKTQRYLKKKSSSVVGNKNNQFAQIYQEEQIIEKASKLQQQYIEQGYNTETVQQEKNPLVLLALNKFIAEEILEEQQKIDNEIQQWISIYEKERQNEFKDQKVQDILKDTQQNLRLKDKIVEQIVVEQEQDQKIQKNVLISKDKFNMDIENILKEKYYHIYQKLLVQFENNNVNNNSSKEIQTDITNEKYNRDKRRNKLQIQNLQLEIQSLHKKNKKQVSQQHELKQLIDKKQEIIEELQAREEKIQNDLEYFKSLNQKQEQQNLLLTQQNQQIQKEKSDKQEQIELIRRQNQKIIKDVKNVLQKTLCNGSSMLLDNKSLVDKDNAQYSNVYDQNNMNDFKIDSYTSYQDNNNSIQQLNSQQLSQILDREDSQKNPQDLKSIQNALEQQQKSELGEVESSQQIENYTEIDKLQHGVLQLIQLIEKLKIQNQCYQDLYTKKLSQLRQNESLSFVDLNNRLSVKSRKSRKSKKQIKIEKQIEKYRDSFMQKLLTSNGSFVQKDSQCQDIVLNGDKDIDENHVQMKQVIDDTKQKDSKEERKTNQKKELSQQRRNSVRKVQKKTVKNSQKPKNKIPDTQMENSIKSQVKPKRMSVQMKKKTQRKSVSIQGPRSNRKSITQFQVTQTQNFSQNKVKKSQFFNIQEKLSKNQSKIKTNQQQNLDDSQSDVQSNKSYVDIQNSYNHQIKNNNNKSQYQQQGQEIVEMDQNQELQDNLHKQEKKLQKTERQSNELVNNIIFQKNQSPTINKRQTSESKRANFFKTLFKKSQLKEKQSLQNEFSQQQIFTSFFIFKRLSNSKMQLEQMQNFGISMCNKVQKVTVGTFMHQRIRLFEKFFVFNNYKRVKYNKRCQTEKKKQFNKQNQEKLQLPQLQISQKSFKAINDDITYQNNTIKKIKSVSVRNRKRSNDLKQDFMIQTSRLGNSERKIFRSIKKNKFSNQKMMKEIQQKNTEQSCITEQNIQRRNMGKIFRFKGNTLIKINEKIKENKTKIQKEYLKGLEKLIIKNTQYNTLEDYFKYKNQKKQIITGSIVQNKNEKQIALRKKLLYSIQQDLQMYSQVLTFEDTKKRLYTLIDTFFEVHSDICEQQCNHYKHFQNKLKSVMKMIHEEDMPKIQIQTKIVNNRDIQDQYQIINFLIYQYFCKNSFVCLWLYSPKIIKLYIFQFFAN